MNYRVFPFIAPTFCALLFTGCSSNTSPSSSGSQAVASANVLTPKGSTNFTAKEAGFSIYFPVKATQTRTAGNSQWGKYDTFTYQCKAASASYAIIATTIPSGVDTSDATRFIDGVETGFLKSSRASIQKSREVTLNGTPGRELFTTIKAGTHTAKGRMFIYFTPQTSYQVMAVGLDKEFQTPQAQRESEKVLRSFRLLAK